MSAPELKPCPFCGGEAEMFTEMYDRTGELVSGASMTVTVSSTRTYHGVRCPRCDIAMTNPRSTPADAIAAWNRRTPTQAPEGWQMVPVEPTSEMAGAGVAEAVSAAPLPWFPEAWRAALSAAPQPPTDDGWLPISEAPRDGQIIIRWHLVWKCPVAVQRNDGKYPGYPEWIAGTRDQTWPEEAFAPCFLPATAVTQPPTGGA